MGRASIAVLIVCSLAATAPAQEGDDAAAPPGGDPALQRLIDGLAAEDLDTRSAAEAALIEMGPGAVKALRAVRAGADASVLYRIDRVIGAITSGAEARRQVELALAGRWPDSAQAARQLRELGAAALPPLEQALPAVAGQARMRLEDLALAVCQRLVEELSAAVDATTRPPPAEEGAQAAAATLEAIPQAAALLEAAPLSAYALAQGTQFGVESTAASCARLLEIGAQAAAAQAAADPEGWTRRVQALGFLAAPLAEQVAQDAEAAAAGIATEALGRMVAAGIGGLGSEDEGVRRHAARTLFRIGERALEAVRAAAAGDDTALTHEAARLARRMQWRISERLYRRLGHLMEGYEAMSWQDRRSRLAEAERLGGGEALPFLRTALERDPSVAVKVQAAYSLARLGDRFGFRFLEAAGIVPRLQTPGDIVAIHMDQGIRYLQRNDFERAEAEFLAILELEPENYLAEYNLACTYSLWGRPDEALDLLERSLEHGFDNLEHIAVDDDLDPLRELPRFRQLIQRFRQRLLQEGEQER